MCGHSSTVSPHMNAHVGNPREASISVVVSVQWLREPDAYLSGDVIRRRPRGTPQRSRVYSPHLAMRELVAAVVDLGGAPTTQAKTRALTFVRSWGFPDRKAASVGALHVAAAVAPARHIATVAAGWQLMRGDLARAEALVGRLTESPDQEWRQLTPSLRRWSGLDPWEDGSLTDEESAESWRQEMVALLGNHLVNAHLGRRGQVVLGFQADPPRAVLRATNLWAIAILALMDRLAPNRSERAFCQCSPDCLMPLDLRPPEADSPRRVRSDRRFWSNGHRMRWARRLRA